MKFNRKITLKSFVCRECLRHVDDLNFAVFRNHESAYLMLIYSIDDNAFCCCFCCLFCECKSVIRTFSTVHTFVLPSLVKLWVSLCACVCAWANSLEEFINFLFCRCYFVVELFVVFYVSAVRQCRQETNGNSKKKGKNITYSHGSNVEKFIAKNVEKPNKKS